MQNKGIYTDISRNAIAIRTKSARNSLQHIQKRRRGSRADCITLSRRSISEQPEPIKPSQSSLSRSACTGFFAALRSGECAAGSHLPYLSCQRSAFCGFLRFFQPNCTKLLLCAITKTRKTAHLLTFCKRAGFHTNFCRQFLPDYCGLYGL